MVGSNNSATLITPECTTWNKMLTLVIALVVALGLIRASEIPVAAIDGGNIKLKCNIKHSSPANIEWLDFVYNSSPEPIVIFSSVDNHQRTIHAEHPNRASYTIDSDFTLTIHRVKLDEDPGQYICRSRMDGKTIERKYYLTVGNEPTCTGSTNYREADQLDLECESQYSGKNQPILEWYRNEERVEMVDMRDLMLAKYGVHTAASYADDQAIYECRMTFGNFTKKCSLEKFNVTYFVRDIKFSPMGEKLESGEELKCSAKGNPAPMITMMAENPKFEIETRGDGVNSQSFILSKSLEGQEVTVSCIAANQKGELDMEITEYVKFLVTGGSAF